HTQFNGVEERFCGRNVVLIEVPKHPKAHSSDIVISRVSPTNIPATSLKQPHSTKILANCVVLAVGQRTKIGPGVLQLSHIRHGFVVVPTVRGAVVYINSSSMVNMDLVLDKRTILHPVANKLFSCSRRPPLRARNENDFRQHSITFPVC